MWQAWNVPAPAIAAHYDMTGWTQLCAVPYTPSAVCIAMGHPTGLGYSAGSSATTTGLCSTNSQPLTNGGIYGQGNIPPGWRTLRIGPMITAGAPSCFARFNIREHWTRPNGQPAPEVPWIPEQPGAPGIQLPPPAPELALPPWLAGPPMPYAPTPLPITPPFGLIPRTNPDPLKAPRQDPVPGRASPRARQRVRPRPGLSPREVPGIARERSPTGQTKTNPENHRKEPPGKDEKEKKKTFSRKSLPGAFRVIEGLVGGFTEMDDFVAALYRSLPWQQRRWRGRDGVWRERDIRTDTRLQRLWENLDDADIGVAIKNLGNELVVDRAIGMGGSAIRRAVKVNPYWRSPVGPSYGGRLRKDTWDKLLEDMQRAAAAGPMTEPHSIKMKQWERDQNTKAYWANRVYEHEAGIKRLTAAGYRYAQSELSKIMEHARPYPRLDDTMIPWLRKRSSFWKRPIRRGKSPDWRLVVRHWYRNN